MASKTETDPCPTEKALTRSLVEATVEILDLGCLELAAVINREPAEQMNFIRRDLERAMKSKSQLLDQYDSHIRVHRCEP